MQALRAPTSEETLHLLPQTNSRSSSKEAVSLLLIDIDHFKKQLNCENYKNFYDLRRWVIEPAVAEINEFADIKIAWDAVKEKRKVVRVVFYMVGKKKTELLEADRAINDALDGQIDLAELMKDRQNSVKAKFFRENCGTEDEV